MSEQIQQQPEYRKRFGILIGAVVGVAALILAGVLWMTGNEDTEEPDSKIHLTAEERRTAEIVVEDFLYSIGEFGYKLEELNGDNIFQVMDLNRAGDTDALSMYATFRHQAYLNARDQYTISESPLYYPTSTVYEWSVALETEEVFNYSINTVDIDVPDTAQLTFLQGEDRKTVVVPVVLDTEQTRINEGTNDSSWDGSHQVFKRHIPNVTATVVLVQIENEWKVYNLRDISHPFLFATWKDAYPDNQRFEIADGFSQDSTLTPSEPFDFEEWLEERSQTGGQ